MRVLHLQLGDGPVEIHPYVTVVRGCSPADRQEILDVFAALPSGRALAAGLIEAHGVLLDLDDDSLAMLDLRHDLDTIVRGADLPHGGAGADAVQAAERQVEEARARLRAAEAALVTAAASRDDVRAALGGAAGSPGAISGPAESLPGAHDAEARARIETAAVRATGVHERAQEALAAAEAEAAAAAAAHAGAVDRLQAAERALERASDSRDPTAGANLEAARRRLAEAEGAVESARSGKAPEAAAEGASIEQVKEERLAIEAALLALETTDPLPVRLALADLGSERRESLVPSPEALALADRWAIVTVDLARLGAATPDEGPDAVERRAAARRRLVQAEAEVARVEAAVRGPRLDPDDVAELERLHDEVLGARDAAEKRFGGAKAAQRLEEASAAEAVILDRLGFLTWADFRLGAPAASVATEAELTARLADAQRALREAQAEHHALEASIDAELVKAEVVDRRRTLRRLAVDLLGADPGDDVEGALRRHRVAVEDTGAHLTRLRAALDGAGMVLDGEELDEDLLTELATTWLAERDETEKTRERLERQLAEVDLRLAQLQASERSGDGGDALATAISELDDARAALAAATDRVDADAAATAAIDDLRQEFEAASEGEQKAARRVGTADEQVLAAAAMLRAADEELRRDHDALAGIDGADHAAAVAAADRAEGLARVEAAAGDAVALEAALDTALDRVEQAREAYADAGRSMGEAMAALGAARGSAEAADADSSPAGDGGGTTAEDLEWYLLARLAAQRSVSFAGSVPLVLDDTFAGLDPASTHRVLERLERMASTVQLVILTEDLSSASWAESLGAERALVVQR